MTFDQVAGMGRQPMIRMHCPYSHGADAFVNAIPSNLTELL